MTAPDIQAVMRETIAHLLRYAEIDERAAVRAASDYEAIDREIFKGLKARFDTELSRQKADRKVTA